MPTNLISVHSLPLAVSIHTAMHPSPSTPIGATSPSHSHDGFPPGRPPDHLPLPTTPPGAQSPLQSDTPPTRTQLHDSISPDFEDERRASDQPVTLIADPLIERIDDTSAPYTPVEAKAGPNIPT